MSHAGTLKDRPTSEVVILLLALVIAISVLVTPPAVLIVDIYTDRDTRATIESYVNLMNVLVGAVVGYISARHSAVGDEPGAGLAPNDTPTNPAEIPPATTETTTTRGSDL